MPERLSAVFLSKSSRDSSETYQVSDGKQLFTVTVPETALLADPVEEGRRLGSGARGISNMQRVLNLPRLNGIMYDNADNIVSGNPLSRDRVEGIMRGFRETFYAKSPAAKP